MSSDGDCFDQGLIRRVVRDSEDFQVPADPRDMRKEFLLLTNGPAYHYLGRKST